MKSPLGVVIYAICIACWVAVVALLVGALVGELS